MENEHISGLFGRIRAKLAKQTVDTTAVIQIVIEETKIRLKESDISIKKGTLHLSLSHLKKGEIQMKKKTLLGRIQKETGLQVVDIK